MITRLDHIQLAMPAGGEDEARKFFVGILSMTEEAKPEPLASRGGCWFKSGPVIVHLGVERDFAAQKKAHPAFCVENLKLVSERLMAQGFVVTPDHVLANRQRIYTQDPFGNRIELIQDGDGFTQKVFDS